jgi:hypothetical protein
MEEGTKSKNKKRKNKKPKFNSFEISNYSKNPKNRSLFYVKPDIKCKSCKNVVNFVPRILPKKSFCKPSFFILNPEEFPMKKLSEKEIGENLLIVNNNSNSDSEDNSSELLSSEENNDNNEKRNKNETNNNKEKLNEDENKMNINSKQDFNSELKSNFDGNKDNININNNIINDDSDTNKRLSILDVLLMNHNS